MLFFKKNREIKVSEYLDRELTDNQAIDISESLAFDPELNSLASDLFDTNTVVNNVLRKTNPTPNYPQISLKSTETSPGLHKKNLNESFLTKVSMSILRIINGYKINNIKLYISIIPIYQTNIEFTFNKSCSERVEEYFLSCRSANK